MALWMFYGRGGTAYRGIERPLPSLVAMAVLSEDEPFATDICDVFRNLDHPS
jgi:hypothetical protein